MKTKFTKIFYSFVFILVMNNVSAQVEEFAPDATDNVVAPINDYLIPMLVLGILLGYRFLRKKTETVK
jgi:hypothetical protein